jgi:predicted Zn-dependent peptidase
VIAARVVLGFGLCALLTASAAATAPPALPISTLDLGSAPFYVQNDATSALAGIQILVRAGLDRERPAQSGLAALTAETIARTPVDGVPLADAIAARGGTLSSSVGPQYVRFYLQAEPATLAALAPLLAHAIAAPDTSAGVVSAARAVVAAHIADDESNPVTVGLEMVRQSYYTSGAALPIYGTTGTLANLTGADVRAFVAAHYVRGNAIVSAAGNVTPAVNDAARTLASAFAVSADAPAVTAAKPFGDEPKEIVTHRDIGVPYLVMGFAAPAVADADFAPMLVVRAVLGDAFARPSATTLPVISRAVGVVYAYDANPAEFAVYINGSQLDPARGLTAVQGITSSLAQTGLNADQLKRYKTIAHGEWQTEDISLADRAFAIGNFVAFGAAPDSGPRIADAIDAVSAADVKRVAAKYLKRYTVALVIPRASDKSPG